MHIVVYNTDIHATHCACVSAVCEYRTDQMYNQGQLYSQPQLVQAQ